MGRELEDDIVTDLRARLSYGEYLHLEELLGAQHPLSRPEHHDELLFIIQHQTSELWMHLVLHELRSARSLIADDDVQPAFKMLTRVARIFEQLNGAWDVLRTMTPMMTITQPIAWRLVKMYLVSFA